MIVGSRHQPLPAPRRGFFERIGIVRRVNHGAKIPRGYGIAWHAWTSDEATAMPIPLNLAAAGARAVWLRAKRGGYRLPATVREAYEAGRQDERRQWAQWANPDHG